MTNDELEEWLSRPTPALMQSLKTIDGDLLLLGAGGKMGPTLARMARRALPDHRTVYAVSRFTNDKAKRDLEQHGVIALPCDLLDRKAVSELPDAANVVFMAGQKFGTSDNPEATWMINGVLPSLAAERYANSRIVAFSTGCVYSLAPVSDNGSVESDSLNPPGEYAWSCVARERVFQHYAKTAKTRVLLFRLNYAIDLRYGVLHDVATRVWNNRPIDVAMGHVNVIWQGDANARALQCLALAENPASILNVTGRECIPIRWLAEQFGHLMKRNPIFTGYEADLAWLSNASRSFELFGDVTVSLDDMIQATSDWIRQGGTSLGKPTHFETPDGKF